MSETPAYNPEVAERLEARAAKLERDAQHVSAPNFPPPWGADIVEGYLLEAADLRSALAEIARLQSREAELQSGRVLVPREPTEAMADGEEG